MDYRQLTSPCGLDCFHCPLYLAANDQALRTTLADQLGIPPAMALCRGCRNTQGTVTAIGRNQQCYIYRCAQQKAVDFCCDCSDFPCDYLHPYADQASHRPHNTKLFNLCLIKKMGLQQWATEKAAKVKATYFHGTIRLHDHDE